MKHIPIRGIILIVAITIINVFVFSNLSVCIKKSYIEKELEFTADVGEGVNLLEDGSVFIEPSGGWVEIDNINLETAAITLVLETQDNKIIEGNLFSTDEGRQYDFARLVEFSFNNKHHIVQKAFSTSGELKSLRIEVGSSSSGVYLEKIVLNQHTTFRFNFLTYFIMLFITGIICWIKKVDWLKDVLDYSDKRQIVAIWVTKGFCIVLMLLIIGASHTKEKLFVPYEKGAEVNGTNIYMALFDSLHQGTTKMLAYDVDPRLEELDNVYDWSERKAKGIDGRWDMAYYQGNYYCYFGMLPVIALFECFYIFTGYLPGMVMLSFILLFWGIFFLFGATRRVLEYFEIKPKIFHYLLSNIVMLFSSFYFIIASNPDHYTLTIVCAIDCLLACIYFAYNALLEEKKMWRALKYVACGISFVGIAATRPAVILMGMAFIFPPFLRLLFEKNVQCKNKIIDVLTFAIPVFIGAGILMIYNYVRFDSPFEFGAKYQLTVSDIRYNTVTLNFKNLLGALYCYFLEPVKFEFEFPFVLANDAMLFSTFGKAWYGEACIGIFAIPFNLLAVGMFMCNKERNNSIRNITCCSILVATLIIAITDFAMGGVVGRYVGDFAIGLTFLAFIVVMELSMKGELDGGMLKLVVNFIMVSSIILGVLLLFKNDLIKNCIITKQPDLFLFLSNMFDI